MNKSTNNPEACSICGGVFEQVVPYLNIAYSNAPELQDLQITICSNCGIGTASPERSWDVMRLFYEKRYRSKGSDHKNVAGPLASKYSIVTRALSQWMLLKTFRSFDLPDSFCDIGPGGGEYISNSPIFGVESEHVCI